MGIRTIIKGNANAFNKFIRLSEDYSLISNDFVIDSLLDTLESPEHKYLTVETDMTVRLLCVIKIVCANKIGGDPYRRAFVPIGNHCLYFIEKNISKIPFANRECFYNAIKKAEQLSTRGRNILEKFTPSFLLIYIQNIADLQSVIRESQNCGRKTYDELLDFALSIRPSTCVENSLPKITVDPFENISSEKDGFLSNIYSDMLASLSVRSRHILESIAEDYKHFIKLSYKDISEARSCGKNSAKEISVAQCTFREDAINILSTSSAEFKSCSLKYQYPFLKDEDIRFCGHFYEQKGRLPMFYILEHLLFSSSDRFSKFFILSNGINCTPLSLKEIGKLESISYERVRQISRKPPTAIVNFLNSNGWKSYTFWMNDYLSELSVGFQSLIDTEQLTGFSFEAYIDLLCVTFGYEVIQVKGESIAVSKRFYECFDFKSSIEDLEASLKMKTYNNSIIPLETFVSPYIIEYHSVCDYVLDIYKEVLISLEYEINSDNCLIINSNRVDIENILYNILKKEGSPLHIDVLFVRFKELYPEHKYKESSRIRPALQSSERICPQGKSSTYALIEWNLYSGSRRDYANDLLNASPIPIPRKELIKKVMLRFPESSENSIASTISQSDQYELYVGDLLGLVSKEYPPEYIIADYSGNRKSFEARLSDLVDFFEKYHYSPQYGGDYEEKSLQRWVYNTRTGRTKVTEEQYQKFEAVFEKYADYCLTGDEYAFSKRCEDFQAFVSEYFELPSRETDLDLTRWFESAMSQQFSDKRKEMLDKLLLELSNYGFIF